MDHRPLDMKFCGMIFDFNGVLWWDTSLQERAWRQTAVLLRGRPLAPQEIVLNVYGRTNRDSMEYLAGHPLAEEETRRLILEKEAFYRDLCLQEGANFRLSPGAEDLLGWLSQNGIPRTIATASGRDNVDFFVEYLGLGKWFDPDRIVCDDGRMPGKLAPDIYLRAAVNLGLDPAQCVVVEDSISGLRAARAAGIGHVIALGPKRSHTRLRQTEGVREAVENLGQVDARRLFSGG